MMKKSLLLFCSFLFVVGFLSRSAWAQMPQDLSEEEAVDQLSFHALLEKPLQARDAEMVRFYFALAAFLNEESCSRVLSVEAQRAVFDAWLPDLYACKTADVSTSLTPMVAKAFLVPQGFENHSLEMLGLPLLCVTLKYAEELYKRCPQIDYFANQYAWSLIVQQPMKEGYRKAIEVLQTREMMSAGALDTLGWAYFRSGDVVSATQCLLDAASGLAQVPGAQSDSSYVTILVHLGDVLYVQGRHAEALRSWTTALKSFKKCCERDSLDTALGAILYDVDAVGLQKKIVALRRQLKKEAQQTVAPSQP